MQVNHWLHVHFFSICGMAMKWRSLWNMVHISMNISLVEKSHPVLVVFLMLSFDPMLLPVNWVVFEMCFEIIHDKLEIKICLIWVAKSTPSNYRADLSNTAKALKVSYLIDFHDSSDKFKIVDWRGPVKSEVTKTIINKTRHMWVKSMVKNVLTSEFTFYRSLVDKTFFQANKSIFDPFFATFIEKVKMVLETITVFVAIAKCIAFRTTWSLSFEAVWVERAIKVLLCFCLDSWAHLMDCLCIVDRMHISQIMYMFMYISLFKGLISQICVPMMPILSDQIVESRLVKLLSNSH